MNPSNMGFPTQQQPPAGAAADAVPERPRWLVPAAAGTGALLLASLGFFFLYDTEQPVAKPTLSLQPTEQEGTTAAAPGAGEGTVADEPGKVDDVDDVIQPVLIRRGDPFRPLVRAARPGVPVDAGTPSPTPTPRATASPRPSVQPTSSPASPAPPATPAPRVTPPAPLPTHAPPPKPTPQPTPTPTQTPDPTPTAPVVTYVHFTVLEVADDNSSAKIRIDKAEPIIVVVRAAAVDGVRVLRLEDGEGGTFEFNGERFDAHEGDTVKFKS